MQKIISLFKRNYDGNRQVFPEVVPGAEWVLQGEGYATRKYDGTCCMIKDGILFKRYEVKKGKTAPEDFTDAGPVDPNTGKQQGWRPVGVGPEDKYHRLAFFGTEEDGTYELLGPKIQGNPEGRKIPELIKHGCTMLPRMFVVNNSTEQQFNEIFEFLKLMDIEGIVWHHKDGRMVKIKKKDFGLKR